MHTLRIKRSEINDKPINLSYGELAWSETSQTLFIGNRLGSIIPIGGTGEFLSILGGTLRGPLSIINSNNGPSISTNNDLLIGDSAPHNLGMHYHPNDRLLTITGNIDRPGNLLLNNPKLIPSPNDIAGRITFNLSNNKLGVTALIDASLESNLGGSLHLKVRKANTNKLIDAIYINDRGDTLLGYGNYIPRPHPSIPLEDGDRVLSVRALSGGTAYLTLGQGSNTGTLRWYIDRFQYYDGTNWIDLIGEGSTNTSPSPTYTTNIGDGTNYSFIINHNLGTRDVVVSIFRNNSNYDDVYPSISRPSTHTVMISFSEPPSVDEYRVVIKA